MKITKDEAIERLRARRDAGTLTEIARLAGKSLPTIRSWDLKDRVQAQQVKQSIRGINQYLEVQRQNKEKK